MVPEKSLGTGIGKIWYRKKVSEPVSEKFGTGADFCRNFFLIWKIYNGYRYRNREFFIFSGGIGTGIGKIWYRKKVSEPVSVKFGTGKSTGIGIENIWYRKKYRYRYRLTFWVPSHTVSSMINKNANSI